MNILQIIRFSSVALLLLAAIPAATLGQRPTGTGGRPALPSPSDGAGSSTSGDVSTTLPAPKATLADLAWLAGRWQGSWGPRVAQQVWTAPKAGVMMGTFQLTENDKTLVLELFTVVEEPGGIKFHLRHFTTSLVAWEKSGPTVLNLAGSDPKSVAFENPTDGQPKRVVFTRVDADTYISRSEVVPEKGQVQVTEITYHRQKDVPPVRR